MDTSDPFIEFDEHGFCNHCRTVENTMNKYPHNLIGDERNREIDTIVKKIKYAGRNRTYDCIIGVSGGIDSTYVAYLVKQMGLRPLAVHLDNGWDSEEAVHNIEKTLTRLHIELYTYVINWNEFRDLQMAFLKASTPDSEIPSDHAIVATLFQVAAANNIKYIIIGCNFSTESILPQAWSHGHNDWKYIRNVHQLFGRLPLKTFPHYSHSKFIYYRVIKGIKQFNILDYVDYSKELAIKKLENELGWKYYGGKHQESVYTKFFQLYLLPEKFGYDKRKAHLSSLICSGQITREQALSEMQNKLYRNNELREDKRYVVNKLGIGEDEFEHIMRLPPKSFWDYPSYEKTWYFKIAMKVYSVYRDRMSKL